MITTAVNSRRMHKTQSSQAQTEKLACTAMMVIVVSALILALFVLAFTS